MIKLSQLGKDLLDGVPKKTVKDFLEALLNKEEILEIKNNELNKNFNLNNFFSNIESSLDLDIFITSIYKDPRLNIREKDEEELKSIIYQNIFNIITF